MDRENNEIYLSSKEALREIFVICCVRQSLWIKFEWMVFALQSNWQPRCFLLPNNCLARKEFSWFQHVSKLRSIIYTNARRRSRIFIAGWANQPLGASLFALPLHFEKLAWKSITQNTEFKNNQMLCWIDNTSRVLTLPVFSPFVNRGNEKCLHRSDPFFTMTHLCIRCAYWEGKDWLKVRIAGT